MPKGNPKGYREPPKKKVSKKKPPLILNKNTRNLLKQVDGFVPRQKQGKKKR